jgi:hypothetical protein
VLYVVYIFSSQLLPPSSTTLPRLHFPKKVLNTAMVFRRLNQLSCT